MKKQILKYTSALLLIFCMGTVSCDDRDDEITELSLDRVLTPYKLESELFNITELTLTWKAIEGAEGYVVELYTDELEFKEENFYYKGEVSGNVFKHNLQGDTQFSARVKAVSSSQNDSKWSSGVAFKTAFKSMFLPKQDSDITHNAILLRWPAGMKSTKLILTTLDDELVVEHTVTADEISKGIAEITGLTENTRYIAALYNGEIRLGVMDVTTSIDVGDAIVINDKDELVAKLAVANDGDLFLLMGGVYDVSGVLAITKSISIVGDETDKPVLNVQFDVENALVVFKNLKLDGTNTLDHVVRLASTSGTYDGIVFDGCDVKNYKKSIVAGESSAVVTVNKITIINSIFTDILTDGAEAIDIRSGYVEFIEIANSTFNNVAPSRSLIRLDEKSSTFPGKTSVIVVENNTFHKVSNSASYQGFFYVRFITNSIVFKNNLVTNTLGFLNKSSSTTQPTCEGNNYFTAPNFLPGSSVSGVKVDTGTPSSQDPEYLKAEDGDFTVGNPSVTAGDPRWLSAE